jgi:hypothetical protein
LAGGRGKAARHNVRSRGVEVSLRHADAGTTMNLYTQAVSEQKRAAHSSVVRLVLPLAEIGEGQATGHFWTRTES